jgi:hypothetical protein
MLPGVPPPPTPWDFIKRALDRHKANRIRIQREQARRARNPLDGAVVQTAFWERLE